nr:MAG TPA: hypothetical protein [Caudoviricetes sp.]
MGRRRRQPNPPVLLHGVPRDEVRRQHVQTIRPVARRRGRHRRGDHGKPYRIGEWPDDSLGKLSVILAHHFGGTPWTWRNEASELDWGTAIGLLEQEMERMEEAEHGA